MRQKYLLFALSLLAAGCRDKVDKIVTAAPGVSYSNGAAGQQVVSLPDGNHVTIGSGTIIVPSKGFGKESREVDIDGEGMFELAGSEAAGDMGRKPFVVHTGNLVIEVLDTTGSAIRFAVDAVRQRPGEEIDLLSGRLRVSKSYHSDTDSLPEELTAGNMIMINREIDLMEKEKMTGPEEDKVKEKYHIADK